MRRRTEGPLGDGYVPRTEEEMVFCRMFDAMFENAEEHARKSMRDCRPLQQSARAFYDIVLVKGEEGSALAALLLRDELDGGCPGERRFAEVMTHFARHYLEDEPRRNYDDVSGTKRPLYFESRIHHVGRIVAKLAVPPKAKKPRVDDRMPAALVAWCEYMGGIEEETAVIRGALFSPSIDQRLLAAFWERAMASDRFPMRMFSDPCRSEKGVQFSSLHAKTIARIFSVVPEPVMRRIATHMVAHATHKRALVVPEGAEASHDVTVPATADERRKAFQTICDEVDDPIPRAIAEQLFAPILARA